MTKNKKEEKHFANLEILLETSRISSYKTYQYHLMFAICNMHKNTDEQIRGVAGVYSHTLS